MLPGPGVVNPGREQTKKPRWVDHRGVQCSIRLLA